MGGIGGSGAQCLSSAHPQKNNLGRGGGEGTGTQRGCREIVLSFFLTLSVPTLPIAMLCCDLDPD